MEQYDISESGHQRAVRALRRVAKARKAGVQPQSIPTKLKRLEGMLYWYRNTVETSPEVTALLAQVAADIETYEGVD